MSAASGSASAPSGWAASAGGAGGAEQGAAVKVTMCASSSKKQEAILAALSRAGVRFEKEPEGKVSARTVVNCTLAGEISPILAHSHCQIPPSAPSPKTDRFLPQLFELSARPLVSAAGGEGKGASPPAPMSFAAFKGKVCLVVNVASL